MAWRRSNTPMPKGWYQTRRRILQRDPVCKSCGSRPSVTVDHVINRASGGSNEDSNLAGQCARCANKKTQREAVRARKPVSAMERQARRAIRQGVPGAADFYRRIDRGR